LISKEKDDVDNSKAVLMNPNDKNRYIDQTEFNIESHFKNDAVENVLGVKIKEGITGLEDIENSDAKIF